MTTSLVSDIRDNLARVVAGDLTIREFEAWFVPATWNVERSADREATRLAHKILHQVTEYDSGLWDDDEFRARLHAIMHHLPETDELGRSAAAGMSTGVGSA